MIAVIVAGMDMVTPSAASTVAFVAICIAVVIAFVLGVRRGSEPEQRARWTGRAIALAVGWLIITGLVPLTNILRRDLPVPPVMDRSWSHPGHRAVGGRREVSRRYRRPQSGRGLPGTVPEPPGA